MDSIYLYNNNRNLIKTKCVICDSTQRLESHRIIYRGPYTRENTICLCKRCHLKAHHNKSLMDLVKFLKLIESINE